MMDITTPTKQATWGLILLVAVPVVIGLLIVVL